MEAIQTPTGSISNAAPTGMFAPYVPPEIEIGEPIDALVEARQFVLVSASRRENVATKHGPKTAFDLAVQTTTPGVTRLFSGFTAGIAKQLEHAEAGDLPATVEIVDTPTPRGTTKTLQLIGKLDPAAELSVVAAALPTPIGAIAE